MSNLSFGQRRIAEPREIRMRRGNYLRRKNNIPTQIERVAFIAPFKVELLNRQGQNTLGMLSTHSPEHLADRTVFSAVLYKHLTSQNASAGRSFIWRGVKFTPTPYKTAPLPIVQKVTNVIKAARELVADMLGRPVHQNSVTFNTSLPVELPVTLFVGDKNMAVLQNASKVLGRSLMGMPPELHEAGNVRKIGTINLPDIETAQAKLEALEKNPWQVTNFFAMHGGIVDTARAHLAKLKALPYGAVFPRARKAFDSIVASAWNQGVSNVMTKPDINTRVIKLEGETLANVHALLQDGQLLDERSKQLALNPNEVTGRIQLAGHHVESTGTNMIPARKGVNTNAAIEFIGRNPVALNLHLEWGTITPKGGRVNFQIKGNEVVLPSNNTVTQEELVTLLNTGLQALKNDLASRSNNNDKPVKRRQAPNIFTFQDGSMAAQLPGGGVIKHNIDGSRIAQDLPNVNGTAQTLVVPHDSAKTIFRNDGGIINIGPLYTSVVEPDGSTYTVPAVKEITPKTPSVLLLEDKTVK